MLIHCCTLQFKKGILQWYPENCIDIDATGWSRVFQLEPLVQRQARLFQNARKRDSQAAQKLLAVNVLDLKTDESLTKTLTRWTIKKNTQLI